MKKILITGGTGFIGRNLCEQLTGSYETVAPASRNLNLLDDLAVSRFLSQERFDVIVHAATWNATKTSTKDIAKVFENNLRMFFNLARCRDEYGKMIYYGSGAEFGRENWKPKMREEDLDMHVPNDAYGFSKYIIAKYTMSRPDIYNLRLFGVYGKYEDWRIRFISNACAKALYDMPITIKQNVFFDYMHIDDLVNITRWFIENNPRHKTLNVCTAKTYDLLTLAGIVRSISGKNVDIAVKHDGLGREYSGDHTKLIAETGGIHFKSMEDGIAELYGWYQDNKKNINSNLLLVDP
jgi:GDP-L-fucose synthase